MSVEATIICDECACLVTAARTATQARKELRELGGKTGLPGGKDLCGDCASDPLVVALWSKPAPAAAAPAARTEPGEALLNGEAQKASRVLDWVGVACGLPLGERTRLLAVEFLSRTRQLPLGEAERLSAEVLAGGGGAAT